MTKLIVRDFKVAMLVCTCNWSQRSQIERLLSPASLAELLGSSNGEASPPVGAVGGSVLVDSVVTIEIGKNIEQRCDC